MAELARATGHSTRSLTGYLEELRSTEVGLVYQAANQHELGRIEIRDRFWPYEKQAAATLEDPEQALYVARVRGLFLEPACVRSVFSAADEKLAADWYRDGVPLDHVQRAILMGCARKYVALFNRQDGSAIASLQYFDAIVPEVAALENAVELLAVSGRPGAQDGEPVARSSKLCAGSARRKHRNEMRLRVFRTFFLTHDDHLVHNVFDSVARRRSDRLQFGMSDFLRRNPHRPERS